MKITIITVVFNAVELIENTIINVLDHKEKNDIDFIIIDGGSVDGTVDIIRKYENSIKYWISEQDKGIYDAMNKGWIVSSENSLILFLGAGDLLLSLPHKIETDKIMYGNVRIGKNDKYYPTSHTWRIKLGNTLHHQALLVPKKFHIPEPFNLKYKVYADFDFNQRLYKSGYQFLFDTNFISYAEPFGISAKLNIKEMTEIVYKNFGILNAILSLTFLCAQFFKIEVLKLKNKTISYVK